MFGKRLFSAQTAKRVYEDVKRVSHHQESFAEFKSDIKTDIKYLLDKQIESNTNMVRSNINFMNNQMQSINNQMQLGAKMLESQARSNMRFIKVGFTTLGTFMTLISFGLVWGYDQLKDDISQLKGDINNVKDDVSQLKGDINNVKDDVNQLKGDINNVKDDVNQLKGDINQRLDKIEMIIMQKK